MHGVGGMVAFVVYVSAAVCSSRAVSANLWASWKSLRASSRPLCTVPPLAPGRLLALPCRPPCALARPRQSFLSCPPAAAAYPFYPPSLFITVLIPSPASASANARRAYVPTCLRAYVQLNAQNRGVTARRQILSIGDSTTTS